MNPITKYPWFSILFAIIMVVDIIGIVSYPQVRLASKGMVMASLLAIYIIHARRQQPSVLLGIIFALLGDSFLLFTTDVFFQIGLGCFLVMQLCYATTFWKKRRIPRTKDKLLSLGLALLPLIFVVISWEHIASMRPPVILYAVAITLMLVTAYLRHSRLTGYRQVLAGSVLFVLSDVLLAVDKFMTEIHLGAVWVMLSYMIAQYLIITGLLLDDYRKVTSQETGATGTFSRHKSHKRGK